MKGWAVRFSRLAQVDIESASSDDRATVSIRRSHDVKYFLSFSEWAHFLSRAGPQKTLFGVFI